MMRLLKRFCRDTQGATAIEYGLILFFTSILIIPGATILGLNLNALYQLVAGFFPGP